ncbi:YcxB family protein [Alkalibacterium subtropicum]|nr:YcxB family protein [Alkalibacterium subtropicum]
MIINYEVNEEDFIQFNLHYIIDSPAQRKTYWFLRLLIPLMFSVLIYFIGTVLFSQPAIYWMIIATGFFGLGVLYFPDQYRKVILKQTRKMLSKGKKDGLFGEKTLTISEDAVTVTGDKAQEELKLKDIKRIEQYDDMILIYDSSRSAVIVPTRELSWDEVKIVATLK